MESDRHQSDMASGVEAPPHVEGEPQQHLVEDGKAMHPTTNDIGNDRQPAIPEHEEAVHPHIDHPTEDQPQPPSLEHEELVPPTSNDQIKGQLQSPVLEHEEVIQPTTDNVDDQHQQRPKIESDKVAPAPESDTLNTLQVASPRQDNVVHSITRDVDDQDQHHASSERDNTLSASEDDSEDIILPASSGQHDAVHAANVDVTIRQADDATPERPSPTSATATGLEKQQNLTAAVNADTTTPSDAHVGQPVDREEEQKLSTVNVDDNALLPGVVDAVQPATPTPALPPRTLTPIPLSLHDPTIECVCPPGTIRLAKDIVLSGATKAGPRWIHVPCKPFTAGVPAEELDAFKTKAKAVSATHDPLKHLTQLLGHAPDEKQRLFLKHFTSTFHCDGPCKGPKPSSDWILCQKCCAWQHKPCILYGDRRDRGGPVCNRCFMSFLLHRDEIVEWQRRRLLEAVKEGWMYLNNPENRHQEWRRAWIRRWLARFFEHNQVVFHKYCVARHRAERLTAAQAYYSRVKVMPQVGDTQPTQGRPAAGIKKEDRQAKRRTSLRKQPERKKSLSKAQSIDPDDSAVNGPEASDAADSDEIVVASSTKNKSKAKPKAPPRPARSTGKKANGKRRASSSMSPSPLSKKIKPVKSRAPRKSAPTFGRFDPSMSDDDDGDDNNNKDDVSDPEDMVVQRGRRPVAASQPTISCRCPGKAPIARDCFKCRDCGMHQHYACANDVKDGLSVVCNFCHVRSPMQSPAPPTSRQPMRQGPPHVNRPPKPNPLRPQPAPAPPQQTAPPSQQYDPALQDEVNHLCATVLWREYCSIPMPDEDEPATNSASGPAPPDWLVECQARLMSLLTSAGQQQTTKYLAPALAAWPRQNHQIMQALRELAIYEIFYGSFRKKRKQLGLVLEVLGLEEKGSVWKSEV